MKKKFASIHRISYKISQRNSPHFLHFYIYRIGFPIFNESNLYSPKNLDPQRNSVIVVNVAKKKFHRISPHFLQNFTAKLTPLLTKNSPHLILWQINVRNAVKKIIHCIAPLFLQKFFEKFTSFLQKVTASAFQRLLKLN